MERGSVPFGVQRYDLINANKDNISDEQAMGGE